MQRAIFISYRRSDSEGESGRLSDVLGHRFTEQAVFMDVDAIRPGRDFRKAIEENIQGCAVLLTVIGPDWLDARNTAGQVRLDETNDYVRLEIAAALRRDIPVIPVLVRGAKMPMAEQLPPEISELAYRNGVELTHSRWKSDLQVLVHALEPYMAGGAREQPAAAVKAAPSALPGGPAQPQRAHLHPTVSPEAVEKVAKLLANYIGPIADVVVKRAAARSGSLKELCTMVAEEIEPVQERRRFLSQFPG